MAQAIKRLFPKVKLAIGPAIDKGFYYDLDAEKAFSDEDKEKIEQEMNKIIKEDLPIEKFSLPKEKAIELMKDEPYKIELINDLDDGEEISFYRQGEFTDLCAGPHLISTGKVKSVKILSSSSAYWKGDEKKEKFYKEFMEFLFQRKKELDEYLERLEDAKKVEITEKLEKN